MTSQGKPKKTTDTAVKKRLGLVARATSRRADARARRRELREQSALPGYISFTTGVFQTLAKYWKPIAILLAMYVGLATLFVGLVQQDEYLTLSESIKEFGPELIGGQVDALTRTLGIFGVAVTGGLNETVSEVQQIFMGMVFILMWLVLIWLLRQLLAGNMVKVRDALYNGSTPLISTLLIVLLMIIQSIPAVLGVLIFSLATQGAVVAGVVGMLFAIGSLPLILLSLYWLTSSVFALLIVTLPGTYPMAAVRAAGNIVRGRRLPLMIRLLWLGIALMLMWAVVLVPVLLVDSWLSAGWFSPVPVTIQILSGFSLIFATTYIYLLYRGMINEPAS